MQSTPKPPPGAVARFTVLGDCAGIISDAMDELQIPSGVIGASVLRTTMPGRVTCGPALTVRNIPQRADPLAGRQGRRQPDGGIRGAQSGRGRRRARRSRRLGNVQHGRHLAQTGKRQGERGAIVMGGVRDIPHSRSVDYPIWRARSRRRPANGVWKPSK